MGIKTIGVIGGGVIGSGVAQNLAQTGHKVILIDISEEILNKAKLEIVQNIRFQGMFKKDYKRKAPEEILSRINFTTDYQFLNKVDFLIENVVEKWDIKKNVYSLLEAVCPSDCIFASNTSAIPITRIGSATKRPSKVIGVHFMNPVPLKTLVEVIRGYHTSQQTVEITKALLEKMGKHCVFVNDSPGFVSNRVLMLTINETICLIQDQVASIEDVDLIFKTGFGHKMGPLETADLIGLDTVLFSLEVLYESYNDPKYRPCPLLRKMVYAGLYGRKSGRGFYKYQKSI